jgi:hypothetical protein
MRIVNQQAEKREVFAWTEVVGRNDDQTDKLEYMLSPFSQAQNGRRPINRYDSRNELLAAANLKNCRVTWQDS